MCVIVSRDREGRAHIELQYASEFSRIMVHDITIFGFLRRERTDVLFSTDSNVSRFGPNWRQHLANIKFNSSFIIIIISVFMRLHSVV